MSRKSRFGLGLELAHWHDEREVTSPLRYVSCVTSTDSTKMRAVIDDCDLNVNRTVVERSALGSEQTDWASETHNPPVACAKPAGAPPGAPPAPAGRYTPRRARTQLSPRQISTEKTREAQQIPLNIASYKLYYVN